MFFEPFDGLRNLRTVEAGRLYRSGQPRPEDLSKLISELKLRTVIALRGSRSSDDPDGWEARERSVCESLGVRFVALPCNHKNPPTSAQVAHFLEVVEDPANLPALVHCRIGQQRTGLFCALYRVHVQGVSPDEALAEMDDLGFKSGHRRHQKLLQAFRQAVREIRPKPSVVPAPSA